MIELDDLVTYLLLICSLILILLLCSIDLLLTYCALTFSQVSTIMIVRQVLLALSVARFLQGSLAVVTINAQTNRFRLWLHETRWSL